MPGLKGPLKNMRPITPKKQLLYDILIVVSLIAAAGITYQSLSEGIYEVFAYIYLIPIVLLAFARPKVSIYGTVVVGWIYLGLVFTLGLPSVQHYILAMVWFYVVVSIGILIIFLFAGIPPRR